MANANLNDLCARAVPFFFLSDFEGENLSCYPLDALKDEDIEFSFDASGMPHKTELEKVPVDFGTYQAKLHAVQEYIRNGETYLLNLTQPTPVKCGVGLHEIYALANAPYKLRYKEKFVCFSPEKFVEIIDNKIYTYPMKGTIDASLPDAEATILNDEKEMAEHLMVVDLLRNDLGIVAQTIRVEKFRYIDKIKAGNKELLQVSSKISGIMPENWQQNIEETLKSLLPAGSISGTPKKRTVEIIKEIEGYERGYFTGVFGHFDGKNLYSAVSIRYIEKQQGWCIRAAGE